MSHFDEQIIEMKNASKKKKEDSFDLDMIVGQMKENKLLYEELDISFDDIYLFDETLKFKLPVDYKEMNLKDKKMKYPNENRPQIVYKNKRDTINIGFNFLNEDATEDDLNDVVEIMKKSYKQVNPATTFMETDSFTNDEKKTAYYTFNSFAVGGQSYNVIFMRILSGKLLIMNINCPKKDMGKMKPLFYGIMHTITILD